MFDRTVKALFARHGNARGAAPEPRRARPRLEGLEDRWCPATYYWYGAVSNLWTNKDNWKDAAGNAVANAPGTTDVAILDGARSNNDCFYGTGLLFNSTLCDSLLVQNDYAGDLTIWTNTSVFVLTITNDLAIAGGSNFDLNLGAGNKIAVGDEFYWTGAGEVDRDDSSSLATITAHHINWVGAGTKYLGANVKTTGSGGSSTINLDYDSGANEDYVLWLDKGAVLENGAGTLTHNRGTIDDTAHASHESSYVKNASGATWTKTTNTITTTSLTFENAGTFQVESGTYLLWDYSSNIFDVGYFQTNTGTTKLYSGATLTSAAGVDVQLYFAGGNLFTIGAAAANMFGESELVGTSIRLNQATAGGFGQLNLGGSSMLMRGATKYYCDVSGNSDSYDSISTTGHIEIYNSTANNSTDTTELIVNVVGALGTGRNWYVLAALGGYEGDFDSTTLDGTTNQKWVQALDFYYEYWLKS